MNSDPLCEASGSAYFLFWGPFMEPFVGSGQPRLWSAHEKIYYTRSLRTTLHLVVPANHALVVVVLSDRA